MSSYLNFYLLPKKKEEDTAQPKPLLFLSYSRANDIYHAFREIISPECIIEDNKYIQLTLNNVRSVLKDKEEELEKAESSFNLRMEAYSKLNNFPSAEVLQEYLDDYTETKQYIQTLKDNISELESIHYWITNLEYSDFEKILINIE